MLRGGGVLIVELPGVCKDRMMGPRTTVPILASSSTRGNDAVRLAYC